MSNDIGQTRSRGTGRLEPDGHAAPRHRIAKTAPLHTAMLRSIDKLGLLRTVSIFGQLTLAPLTALAAGLNVQAFGRGQTIFQQGDPGDTLYFVARGQVRVYHPLAAGQELSVAIFRHGDFFGELALLDGQARSASAEAMLPTVTLTLGQAAFRQTIRDHPAIAEALLAELGSRLRASSTFAEHLSISAAHQRVGWLVLSLAQHYGTSAAGGTRIDLQLTQDDLASMFGMTRETVNRVLARFRDQGLVVIEHGQLLVPDCARLERALD
jgi:CRP-like cAMP-binding protein